MRVVSLLAPLSLLFCCEETGNTWFIPAACVRLRKLLYHPLGGIAAAGLVCKRPYSLNSWPTRSAFISPSFLFTQPLIFLSSSFHSPTPVLDVCACVCGRFVSLSTIRQSETFHSDLKKRWWKPGWRGWHSFKSDWSWQTLPPLGSAADGVAR